MAAAGGARAERDRAAVFDAPLTPGVHASIGRGVVASGELDLKESSCTQR